MNVKYVINFDRTLCSWTDPHTELFSLPVDIVLCVHVSKCQLWCLFVSIFNASLRKVFTPAVRGTISGMY